VKQDSLHGARHHDFRDEGNDERCNFGGGRFAGVLGSHPLWRFALSGEPRFAKHTVIDGACDPCCDCGNKQRADVRRLHHDVTPARLSVRGDRPQPFFPPPILQTSAHSSPVTGCTESREYFTSAIFFSFGSALTAASVTGVGTGSTALK